uniref:Uncharacterized protein n=1 Tax=Anguilla anguilla TaxID=7936 RepID=A0A0E9UH28_ANGAN
MFRTTLSSGVKLQEISSQNVLKDHPLFSQVTISRCFFVCVL